MMIREGDRFKSHLTGKLYRVEVMKNGHAVLKAEDGSTEVLTERGNLNLFYAKIREKNRQALTD